MVALAGFTPSAAAALAPAGSQFDGVVRISDGLYYGSGTLLPTGRHILTAAHVVDESNRDQLTVYFTLLGGIVSIPVAQVTIHPGWTGIGDDINHDVAVLELTDMAPSSAPRYDLYTQTDEVGQTFTISGYGAATGNATDTSPPERRAGDNTFDSDATLFNQWLDWNVTGNRQLVFDYDDGTAAHDAFGQHFGLVGLGLGSREAIMTPGDSGGPTFLEQGGEWLVAGVNSYIARPANSLSDIDSMTNNSFGEFAVVMRVSAYRAWIDAVTETERVIMGQMGTRPDHSIVPKTVVEGEATWFLVEIGAAQAIEVSVHYTTRDGSAMAHTDYLPASGEIVFAPGQTWCQVAIETLPDFIYEAEESFSLVLSDPHGGQFCADQTELVAVRVITEADGFAPWLG